MVLAMRVIITALWLVGQTEQECKAGKDRWKAVCYARSNVESWAGAGSGEWDWEGQPAQARNIIFVFTPSAAQLCHMFVCMALTSCRAQRPPLAYNLHRGVQSQGLFLRLLDFKVDLRLARKASLSGIRPPCNPTK
ncbi:hypothetical protein DUNSADRAFT_2293 [Dunaliella salina]|uniref:Encoded protein n=1 Tax=Dunaliella salina TaxID=3046 RepID=A0ABQ7GVW0_DUNSA|nr:hypothetical protein DUNSADRAFT_2293 [Dunaliella salina]|eukprot:KAF5838749.1 hypothetical protein DUNSADRAFT_2293 [Dunaliella salina]